MAINTYYFSGKPYPLGFDFNPSLGQLLVLSGRQVVSETTNEQILELKNGLILKLSGTFSLGTAGHVAGGTITSLEVFRTGNILVQDLTDISLDYDEFNSQAQTNSPAGLGRWLMSGDDTIIGSSGHDDLVGSTGNDVMTGNGGNDSFNGGDGADEYSGGNGRDTLNFESAYLELGTQGVFIDAVNQDATDQYGNTEIFTTMEAFRGTRHDDVMIGKGIAESFMGLGGSDNINGGAGIDEVRYDRDSVHNGDLGIVVDLATGQATDGFGDQDTLANIENVRGTRNNDTISGNAQNNELSGFGGNDTLRGDAGIDSLWGGEGKDTLNGGVGADTMRGGAGNDVYVVNAADIVNENYPGSNGVDTVRSSISFNLANTTRVLGSVENLTLLGSGNTNGTGNGLSNGLTGNGGANILSGAAGNDRLNGGVGADNVRGGIGNDTINGGAGNDTLTGAGGNDKFDFNTALNASTNVDRITDFNVVQDTIRLDNAVMPGVGSSLTSGEFWKSTSGVAHDSTDRIIYETDTGKLFYDSNGSVAGGSTHIATLSANLALTYADFLVI